jgi:hypothetical protein
VSREAVSVRISSAFELIGCRVSSRTSNSSINHEAVCCVVNAAQVPCTSSGPTAAVVAPAAWITTLSNALSMQGKYLAPDGGPPAARLNKYKGRWAHKSRLCYCVFIYPGSGPVFTAPSQALSFVFQQEQGHIGTQSQALLLCVYLSREQTCVHGTKSGSEVCNSTRAGAGWRTEALLISI